jgi:putative glutamine amidotransferase
VGSNACSARIGLPTYVERARWGDWDERAALLPSSYVDAVGQAAALSVLLPPVDLHDGPAVAVAGIDALLLTGGADIEACHYGAASSPKAGPPRPDRDRWELGLLHAALASGLPVLAVCRGMQLLNVALGGTLHQHLPDVVGHDGHRPPGSGYGSVGITIEAASRLSSILGDTADGTCHHHQAVDRVGDGLIVTARSDDGAIEAIELNGSGFVLGVQWHPEQGDDRRLFAALAAAARRTEEEM